MKNGSMKKLTMRSKITVKWTTNPANMGYDGSPDSWDDIRGETMSIRKARYFPGKLGEKIGTGTYHMIKYFRNGVEISAGDIMDCVNDSDYKKYENGGLK